MNEETIPDTVISGLSSYIAGVVERSVEALRNDPDEKFFPNGIDRISAKIVYGKADAEITITGVPQAATSVMDGLRIWSLVRPMITHSAHDSNIQEIVITPLPKVKERTSVSLTLAAGWQIWDLADRSWFALPFKGVPSHMTPDIVWVHYDGGGEAIISGRYANSQHITIKDHLKDESWYAVDFKQQSASKQDAPL